jgi:hypothetical protein
MRQTGYGRIVARGPGDCGTERRTVLPTTRPRGADSESSRASGQAGRGRQAHCLLSRSRKQKRLASGPRRCRGVTTTSALPPGRRARRVGRAWIYSTRVYIYTAAPRAGGTGHFEPLERASRKDRIGFGGFIDGEPKIPQRPMRFRVRSSSARPCVSARSIFTSCCAVGAPGLWPHEGRVDVHGHSRHLCPAALASQA